MLSSPNEQSRSLLFKLSQFLCYGWLAILFLMWQQDFLNILIQRDVGRVVSISTACMTSLVVLLYVRLRFRAMPCRSIAFAMTAGLLQLGVIRTIANHSVERFPS